MTNWLPDISSGTGPLYLRLAEQIERDIERGVLAKGAKLPPQRNLAFDIGVTIGTVSRAYALARERGLVSGEVGRGTYVLDHGQDVIPAREASDRVQFDGTRHLDPPSGKIRFDSTAAPDVGQGELIGALTMDITREHPSDVASYTRRFPDHWFEAGSRWLAKGSFRPEIGRIVPTLGAHAALMAVIAAVTVPGDYIAFEHLTYSQVSRSGELIGRRTTLMQSDEDGVIPEDFERVCAQRHPKMAFLMPAAQNPTVTTMPEARRAAIAEIARRYNVWLLEDTLYGAMTDDEAPLFAEIAPERTFLVGGLSKSVAAGVRGGWVLCPPHYERRIRVAHRMVTGGLPFILAELCARLVLSGEAATIRAKCIEENNARLAMMREALAGFNVQWRPNIPFCWLELPDPWLSSTFKHAAAERGVLIDDADEFKAGRSELVFHHVRFGVSASRNREEVTQALATIRHLLEEGRAGYISYD
ncbi:PLP-dependent aminotransferase family protein [Chelativorans salis]|uniref:PLP-dependent aminotransferase family protein n=1 Tax=Chelativorans salis TaxID=2978478 RepID=A0ABT2LKR5_9HYPH|nr:PLP-dependent aminotransferase family protein [Chelativorans sp. EGI FJ00035]MCT7375185.1 PLP-dependent aminotransferase family protein [Chelativorans sp. EGI FJ00035]